MNAIQQILSRLCCNFFIILIRGYQWLISPVLPGSCRYAPTCSHYAIEAIKVHGPFTGFWLGLKRISRCHPWGSSGYDPVPGRGSSSEVKEVIEKSVAEEPKRRYTERSKSIKRLDSPQISPTQSPGTP